MLLGLARRARVDVIDQRPLPLDRRRRALVADLIEKIVKITDSVDDLAHIRLLRVEHGIVAESVRLDSAAVAIAGAVDTVDVVVALERVGMPARRCELQGVALEEHNANINPARLRRLAALPQAIEQAL